MAIDKLQIPYDDFVLQEIIDPDQFDLNNKFIVDKINEAISVLNSYQDTIGAGNVGLIPIQTFTSNNVQSFLEELVTYLTATYKTSAQLASTSGATSIGLTPIAGVTSTNLQTALASLKSQINGMVLGQIPDGSITKEKLTIELNTVLSNANTHMVDSDIHIQPGERDAWNGKETPDNVRKKVEQTDYKTYRLNKDSEGTFTIIERRRTDGTLSVRSTFSGGTAPQYTTRTIEYFGVDGTTIEKTTVLTLSYDADGDFLEEV